MLISKCIEHEIRRRKKRRISNLSEKERWFSRSNDLWFSMSDSFNDESEENLMMNHLVFSMRQSMLWRYVHNHLDRWSAMKQTLTRIPQMSCFFWIGTSLSWHLSRGKLTLRSRRYCMISFVEYKLSNFKRQWWRIWTVKKTNIYSLPAKNFSQILNNSKVYFFLEVKMFDYFSRDISSVINWKPSFNQFSGI